MKTDGAILSVKIGSKVYIHSKRNGDTIIYNSIFLCNEAVLFLYAAACTDPSAMIAMVLMDFRIHRVEVPCYINSVKAPVKLMKSFYGYTPTDPKTAAWHASGVLPKEKMTF